MTDEEKAEEYATKEANKYYGACFKTEVYKFGDCKHECLVRWEASKQAYLDGLAEGEKIGKEKQCKATEKAQKKTSSKIKELEKENAEMKELIEIQYAENQTLGNNNSELLKKLGTYNEQVEKMKCCGNCSKSCFAQDCEDIVNRCDYATSDSLLFKCVEWELAK